MKKNIAVVAGGFSGEYGISIKSANVVMASIDSELFKPYLIIIDKMGWYYIAQSGNQYPIDINDFSLKLDGAIIRFDCVFIAIHGTPGEDGKLQGYFEMLGIPFTSSNAITSALTFNKSFCNKVVGHYGFHVSKSVHLTENNIDRYSEELNDLRYPVFVKPNCGGSSVGMSKVHDPVKIGEAIERAFHEDSEVLVEEFVKGREMTCGVFKYKDQIIPFPVTEIISKKEFFDFEAKYNPALAEEVVPAHIPFEISEKIKESSKILYQRLNCNGVVRFDFILRPDNELFFLEVNTVPGMTNESIVPKQAKSHGLTVNMLFSMMIEDALYRNTK